VAQKQRAGLSVQEKEPIIRAREELVEMGILEHRGFRNGQPVWCLTKHGEERGDEIIQAYSRLGKTIQ